MTKRVSLTQWIAMMRQEQNAQQRRREQLLFDIATFVLGRAKHYAKQNFGRGIGPSARKRGRSGALMRSIEMARVSGTHFVVEAGGPGVPYAGVQELGTVGKGGTLPSIVPRRVKWLTIPMESKYVGRRATEFDDLRFVPYNSKMAALMNAGGQRAYLLVKRVDIKPRPYLQPAAADAAKEERLLSRLRVLYGSSSLPYEVVKT